MAVINESLVLHFLRDNLLGYCSAQFPDFKPGRHHKLIASKLEDIEAGRLKRLCVLMAPRHGKSKLNTELYPGWFLGRDPKRRILSLSYGQDLSDVFGRSVRNYMKTLTFQALFPDCQLASDSSSVRRFATTQGGSYASIGVGGPSTGRGADLLLLDDLVKDREQADSPVYRESLIDWYKSVARTRLQPGGAIVLIQTRWGTADFVSWLLSETKHENWEVIALPALALERDPLGREIGEALWPESYPLPVLEEVRRTLGTRDWNSLYQQVPLDDDNVIFNSKWIQYYNNTPWIASPLIVHSWDLSFGGVGTNSSWVCGQCWAFDSDNRHCYLLAMTREQLGFQQSIAAIRAMNEKYPASEILIEAKANGAGVIETLKNEIPYIKPIVPAGGKEDRAYSCTPQFERGEVYLPNPKLHHWVEPLLTELSSFPMSVTDDAVDSMTQALNYLQSHGIHWLSIYSMRD